MVLALRVLVARQKWEYNHLQVVPCPVSGVSSGVRVLWGKKHILVSRSERTLFLWVSIKGILCNGGGGGTIYLLLSIYELDSVFQREVFD